MKRILSVPKSEMAKREAEYRQERAAKKAGRKAKLSAIVLLTLFLSVQSVTASPEERASILKALTLRSLVGEGWQLVQESQSLLIVERPMTGWGGPVVQALTTGAHGTKPIIRWSITWIPISDSRTECHYSATVNSQNAFGQVTSIPINNKKNLDYMDRLLRTAGAGLPVQYKGKPK